MKPTHFATSVLLAALLSACSDSDPTGTPDVIPDNNQPDPVIAVPDTSGNTEVEVEARLKTFDNSDAFYSALSDALVNQHQGNCCNAYPENGESELTDTPMPASAPAPSTDSVQGLDTAAMTSPAGGQGNQVTSTNVQELGVDEQDRVKVNAAGTQLFVLSSEYPNQFPGFPVDVPPPPTVLPVDGEDFSTSLPVEPYNQQLDVSLRILALDPESPDASSIKELSLDLGGRDANGFYLYEDGNKSSAIVTAFGGGYWGYWDQPYSFSNLESVIAKVDVTDASNAALSDTFTIDGQIISSRRIGDALFFASRYYPAIPGADPWGQTREQWSDAIASTDLSTLMPQFSRNGSDDRTSLANPSECFVAPVSGDDPYYSPDIITLGVIDLDTMQLRDTQCFLGATETLYANTESVFLATTRYDYTQGAVDVDSMLVNTDVIAFPPDMLWSDPRTSTDIHQFDINSDQLTYAGSGSVKGHLGWNELQKPFRMSESNGYLRVTTMNDQQGPDHSPILLTVLQSDGQGNLKTVSKLPNEVHPGHIGKPGEQLYASRFLGERAYLVTFRQTDPLYVVDLSNPADPQVKGELEIEGYSDYLHPVGEKYLLGIGKNAIADPRGFGDGRGAWVQGIKLSLFDVSDPSSPSEVQSVLLGERGTESVALGNHRAITIQPANDQHPMRLSFGASVYGTAAPATSPSPQQASSYSQWSYTGLHGYDITAGDNASITPRGALVIERSDNGNGYHRYGDDRSVMVNDAVFYVHGKSVYPAMWDNLSNSPQAR